MEFLGKWINPPLIWFIIGLILVLLELANPGIVIIFFGIGAWIVAFICLFFNISINIQLSIFLISSILLLVALRRWFKALFHGKEDLSQEEETFNEYFGKKAVVTSEISPNAPGKVEFQGTYWNAESYETIPEGDTVEIIDRKNITLIVKPL